MITITQRLLLASVLRTKVRPNQWFNAMTISYTISLALAPSDCGSLATRRRTTLAAFAGRRHARRSPGERAGVAGNDKPDAPTDDLQFADAFEEAGAAGIGKDRAAEA